MYILDLVWRVSGNHKLSVWPTVMMTVFLSQMHMPMWGSASWQTATWFVSGIPRTGGTFFPHNIIRAVAT